MVPMGTHLAYVIFMHHFSQQMRKNPDTDNDSKCVCVCFFFLIKSLLMCGMVGAEDLDIMERALFLQPSYLGFNINNIIDKLGDICKWSLPF